MNSDEARKLAETEGIKFEDERKRKEFDIYLNAILTTIRERASKGEYEAYIALPMPEEVENYLKNLGYRFRLEGHSHFSDGPFVPGISDKSSIDDVFTVISWSPLV